MKHLEKGAFLFAYINYFFILCNTGQQANDDVSWLITVGFTGERRFLLYNITIFLTIPNFSFVIK